MAGEDTDPCSDVSNETISLLILATRWQFDTYGLSTVNKCLVNNLRVVDPDDKWINVTCTVLEEDGKILENELKDASKHKVKLRGAKPPRGRKGKPEVSWLNEHSVAYYRHLVRENKHDFIIGHMPYLVDGCLNLRDHSIELHQGHRPKVIIMAHALPLTEDRDVNEEKLTEWLEEADLVFSVGDNIFMKIDSHVESHDIDIKHKLYLLGFPLDFFQIEPNPRKTTLVGEQSILVMTSEIDDMIVSGIDFELAVLATSQASDNIMFSEGSDLSRQLSFSLKVLASREEEKAVWEKMFIDIKERNQIEARAPAFKFQAPDDVKKLIPHLKRGTLLILPLKPNSSLYGLEALVAMASGVPVLTSRNAGIAAFLQSTGMPEPIVFDEKGMAENVTMWKERMVYKLTNPEETQRTAAELRKMLLLDTRIASTHLEAVKMMTGKPAHQIYYAKDPLFTDQLFRGGGCNFVKNSVSIYRQTPNERWWSDWCKKINHDWA